MGGVISLSDSEDYMNKWIGIEDAAEYLGVNKDTIRNWIKRDTGIPANRVGKQWRFKRIDLDLWVKSGKSDIRKVDE